MAITKLMLNGVEYDIGNLITVDGPQLYEGREISEYTWEQLKTKCQNVDYDDIRVGDYKTITLTDGEVVQMQIAGIDTYYQAMYNGSSLAHHIDWISKDGLKDFVQWNTTNNNNGTAEQSHPYMVSNIKSYLNSSVLAKLPKNVGNFIADKWAIIDIRYSESGSLSSSIGRSPSNIGKLWAPSEYEVFGSAVLGTPKWSTGDNCQYPLFANSNKHRIKRHYIYNNIINWWLTTPAEGNFKQSSVGNDFGSAGIKNTDTQQGTVLCFRILG